MVFQVGFMVFHGFWGVSMVFQVGFMVFHGFWMVSMGFQGGFMVFMVFGWFPWFFKVVSWFFMVSCGSRLVFHGFSWFSWFQVGFSWFFSKMYPPKLYPGPTIHSRSAARRAA